jgi:3-phosphoshikimate 1-carboxyvinyltransferase
VARALGFYYLDSGALYRVTALAATRAGVNLDDADAIAAIGAHLPVRFEPDGRVLLAGDDVSDAIRTEQAGQAASRVAVHPALRDALLALQRGYQHAPGLVADGRDMGTVIFPQAPLKVFLTASAEQRAQRRYKQLISKGFSAKLDTLRADLEARDARDTSRSVAPLQAAQDALRLDNSHLNIEQSVDQVLAWWQSKAQ